MGGGIRNLARGLELISFVISSNSISAQISIGEGSFFNHHGTGCVVHEKTVIGKDCEIFQKVSIGAKLSGKESGNCVPIIGNRVKIGAGAVLLGKITIGDDVIIGANAVVVSDVPCGAVVGGVPAKIIYFRKDIDGVDKE